MQKTIDILDRAADAVIGLWNHLDRKLRYTVLTLVSSYAILKAGIDLDATESGILATVLASLVGYKAENDGTLLREGILDDGDPQPGRVKLPE